MFGWHIFVHSLRMVVRNIPAIVRIFWAPTLAATAILVGFLYFTGLFDLLELGKTVEIPDERLPGFFFLWILVLWIVAGVITAWGVTAWHRYVLLEELSTGPIPEFNIGRAVGYFLRLILLGVLTLILLLPIGFVLLAVAQAIWPVAVLLLFGALMLWGVLVLRWVLILPAFALDKQFSLSDSWQAWDALENPGRKALGLILVYGVFQFAVGTVVEVFSFIPALYIFLTISLQVFVWIFNISLLTTLYGHIVEKRELS